MIFWAKVTARTFVEKYISFFKREAIANTRNTLFINKLSLILASFMDGIQLVNELYRILLSKVSHNKPEAPFYKLKQCCTYNN